MDAVFAKFYNLALSMGGMQYRSDINEIKSRNLSHHCHILNRSIRQLIDFIVNYYVSLHSIMGAMQKRRFSLE